MPPKMRRGQATPGNFPVTPETIQQDTVSEGISYSILEDKEFQDLFKYQL